MTYLCPKGHASSEADYCSQCGLRIGGRELVERFMHREKVLRRVRGRRALAV